MATVYEAKAMKQILTGKKPTEVFRELLIENSELQVVELARAFVDCFPGVDFKAMNYIWKWNRPGGTRGLSDERVDEMLLEFLQQAGYLQPHPQS